MQRRIAGLVVVLAAAAGCGGSSSPTTGDKAAPSTSPVAAAVTAPDVDLALKPGDSPVNPEVGFGSVWVPAHGVQSVLRINPANGKVIARIQTGGSEPGGVAFGGGLVWVTHYGSARLLVGINPHSNKVVRRIHLPGESCCRPAVFGSKVWVAAGSETSPAIVGVDMRTGKIGKQVFGIDNPLVVGNKLWALQDGTVVVVDPKTGKYAATAVPAVGGIWDASSAGGLVWVSQAGSAVGLAADGTAERRVFGPAESKLSFEEGRAVGSADTAWYCDGTSTLWRIDPGAKTAVIAAHFVQHGTSSIGSDDQGGVWVALFDANRVQHYARP